MYPALTVAVLLPILAQTPPPAEPAKPSEDGIPVTSDLVVSKCSACHKKDEKGNLSRISWIRTSPEGWQQAIKRMVRLQNLQLTPDEARQVVRDLSTYHGLAPAEAKPALWSPSQKTSEPPASIGAAVQETRSRPVRGSPSRSRCSGGRQCRRPPPG